MAWFTYQCPTHGKFKVNLPKRNKTYSCPTCNIESNCIINVGTTQILERLDNGLMARAVERLHNVEEILNERADKHTQETAPNIEDNEC